MTNIYNDKLIRVVEEIHYTDENENEDVGTQFRVFDEDEYRIYYSTLLDLHETGIIYFEVHEVRTPECDYTFKIYQ